VEYHGEELIRNDIPNPEEYVKITLRKKIELISIKAVLGETVRFGNIKLLGSKWLIADFNDGHIEGKAIYNYKLNQKGQLEFELFTSIGPE